MRAAIPLREDFDGAQLRGLAQAEPGQRADPSAFWRLR